MTAKKLKIILLGIEAQILRAPPMRMAFEAIEAIGRRMLWAWGRVKFGTKVRTKGIGCVCHWNADLKYPENIHLGDHVVIGVNVTLGAHATITLESRVRISKDAILETAGLEFNANEPPYPHISKPIHIEEGVWIGARSIVLGGVRIGKNSVVAAGSVVTRSFPPDSLLGGTPAKLIKQLNTHTHHESATQD